METFVANRLEAIDWVQEQLGGIDRPLAEMTYRGLVERGLIVEAESIHTPVPLDADTMIEVGKQEMTKTRNSRSRITRRHNSQTYKQKPNSYRLQQGNTIDCIDADNLSE